MLMLLMIVSGAWRGINNLGLKRLGLFSYVGYRMDLELSGWCHWRRGHGQSKGAALCSDLAVMVNSERRERGYRAGW